MKKIYTTLMLAFSLNFANAQSPFWQPTTYKGAFDCTAAMWTDNWTNWDPQNTNYPAPTMTVNSNITSNTTWSTGQTVFLDGQIYVTNNAVLTIQPGVVIRVSSLTAGSSLIITKGARIEAQGTASGPIIFTSDKAPGSRGVGDWGGIIILGQATNNLPGGIGNIEGLPVGSTTEHGGSNDNDNSGTLTYVRNEFGGYPYQVNKEINAFTFGSVGKGTTIHHLQSSFNNDDAYEWFGGTADAKYLVSFRNLDDDFDCDNGFRGNVQFGLIVRDPSLADNPSISTSEGFECDNDAGGTSATPKTAPVFSNITGIGPYRGSSSTSVASGFRRAARLRRNCEVKIFNSLFMDFKNGLFVDGTAADVNAGNGNLKFKHNLIATTSGVTPKTVETTTANSVVNVSWYSSQPNDSLATTAGLLTTPYGSTNNYTNPDYRPVCTTTMVTSGADFTDAAFQAGGIIGIYENTQPLNHMVLYPNPADNQTTLYINAAYNTNVKVELFDITGRLISILYNDKVLETGFNTLPVNTDHLSGGVYFISIVNKTRRDNIKIIVNK